MEVVFYLPAKYLPDAERRNAWKAGTLTTLEQSGKVATAQSWIFQTWLALEATGCPVRLAQELPHDGILVTLAGCVSENFRPGPRLYFVDIVADSLPHRGAQWHLVQNAKHARLIDGACFMPHWPQPGLVEREAARGDRFESIHFFGDVSNLAAELRDADWWRRLGDRLGLTFEVCGADRWHDFRETDCALAIRNLGRREHFRKPATKMYNAWLAGVPFIGGRDSAYAAEGRDGIDYFAVNSLSALERTLETLARDPTRRANLVANGRRSGERVTPAAITARWQEFVKSLPDRATEWRRMSPLARQWIQARRSATLWWDAIRR